MTRDDIQRTALELPPEDRRELVDVLWESLESDPEPLPDWQRLLLDERLAALEANPEDPRRGLHLGRGGEARLGG